MSEILSRGVIRAIPPYLAEELRQQTQDVLKKSLPNTDPQSIDAAVAKALDKQLFQDRLAASKRVWAALASVLAAGFGAISAALLDADTAQAVTAVLPDRIVPLAPILYPALATMCSTAAAVLAGTSKYNDKRPARGE